MLFSHICNKIDFHLFLNRFVGIYNLETMVYERKLWGINGYILTDIVYIPNSNLIGVSANYNVVANAKVMNFVC